MAFCVIIFSNVFDVFETCEGEETCEEPCGGTCEELCEEPCGGTCEELCEEPCGETCGDWETWPWVFLFFEVTLLLDMFMKRFFFFKKIYDLLCYLKRILRYIRKIRYPAKVKVHFRYYHKREKYRCRMKEILQQKFFKKETSIIFFLLKKKEKLSIFCENLHSNMHID